MGYSDHHMGRGHCGICARVKDDGRDLRCSTGGFFVRYPGGCREFVARGQRTPLENEK